MAITTIKQICMHRGAMSAMQKNKNLVVMCSSLGQVFSDQHSVYHLKGAPRWSMDNFSETLLQLLHNAELHAFPQCHLSHYALWQILIKKKSILLISFPVCVKQYRDCRQTEVASSGKLWHLETCGWDDGCFTAVGKHNRIVLSKVLQV